MKFLNLERHAPVIKQPYQGRMLIDGELCISQQGKITERKALLMMSLSAFILTLVAKMLYVP